MIDGTLTSEERALRIREAVESAPMSKTALAELLQVSPQAITGWEKTGRINRNSMAGLATASGRPIEFFIRRKWQQLNDWDDILGFAQAVGLGNGAEAQEYAETHKLKFRADSLARKRLRPGSLAVLYGKGESMLPRVRDGDAILFDTSDTRPKDDGIFVVQWKGEYYAKRAEIIDDTVFFRSDNTTGDHGWTKPKRMDAKRDPITIIGRVRWIGSWED